MKSSSLVPGRFALSGIAAAALCLVIPSAWALGLGRLVVQSSLGEDLRAEIDVSSLTPDEAANLKIRIASPDAYRAAGVDYNAVLPGAQVVLQRRSDGRAYLRLSSDRAVQEPFVDVILELSWNTGRLVREYTLLFDPPTTRAQAPSPAIPPVVAAAPVPARPRTSEASAEPRVATPPAIRTPEARPAATKPAPAAEPRKATVAQSAAQVDSYRVKPGDTLYGIAGQTQPRGVSLDQMLVALYRANPVAFVENNMNRLKAGAVLAVPDADAAKSASAAEARQVIQAQSADFAAYRQRLAGAVAPAEGAGLSRQASGKVQAAVDDRRQVSAPAPDKLTLSAGSASLKASAPEERVSKDREAKDASARAAELKKNVDELQQLAAAAKPAASAGTAPAPAATAASGAMPVATVAAAVAPAVAASAAPEAAGASAPASPTVTAAASRPALAPSPAASEEPGLIGTLLEDPLARAGGGLIVALLVGFGIYSYVRRSRKDSGETSFLESRLQPDSFFGVSGGQRIDTRDAAAGAPSSVSYSMSQLDAIGDVDPVAEADVYLAYGRDLQAEEILKEAMRGNPDRLAIRSKLLEVYAKRRDAKGFELLAQQMFTLTRGEGEEWAKAQELGAQIDPGNPLYRPGGRPELPLDGDAQPVEPLGASTIAQSVLPSPSHFGEIAMATAVTAPPEGADVDIDLDLSVDLDLDLGVPSTRSTAPPEMPETTQPMPVPAPTKPGFAEPRRDASLDFDLASISLDLDAAPPVAPAQGEGDSEALELSEAMEAGSDPFERKLELAEEFRQIGDTDGARDLLQEVIAQTTGAIQAKAQNMLDRMG